MDGARRGRRSLTVRCPFHPDRTPSLCMAPSRRGGWVWICFGCGLRGDEFNFVAYLNGLDVRMEFGKVLAAANLVAMRLTGTGESGDQPSPLTQLSAEDFAVVAGAVLQRARLAEAADVVEYLRHRGVLAEAENAGVGALPKDIEAQEQLLIDVADEVGGDRLLRSGLCGTERGFAWASNRILLPWLDRQSSIVTLQRRSLDNVEPKYVFPSGRGAVLPYGIESFRTSREDQAVAIVEGVIDVFALRVLNRRHGVDRLVIGIGGARCWQPEWAELARGRAVVVALDRDLAGHIPR
ncbi:MAG TPA: CHC2 zinc finger domain-containing protein [Polyangiaceae bacterium]|nr:CHC2 zinc finger domain-containing protein [Polyangiaceae bacterium]